MTIVAQAIQYITESIADSPEAVKVHETIRENALRIELEVAPEDMGRIIGRRGLHINAMRALARVLGKKLDKTVKLELREKERRGI